MKLRSMLVGLIALGLAACEMPAPQGPDEAADNEFEVSANRARGGRDRANGRGLLDFGSGLMVEFNFNAVERRRGLGAKGKLRFEVVLGGELIEFHGRTTCLAVDPAEGRAWIGGVVTRNNSTHPNFTTEIHQPGKDIWFRVLDTGKDSDEPDRSTFVGFEGGGGIITSAEYCDLQIWPDDNARTSPQSRGMIRVKG